MRCHWRQNVILMIVFCLMRWEAKSNASSSCSFASLIDGETRQNTNCRSGGNVKSGNAWWPTNDTSCPVSTMASWCEGGLASSTCLSHSAMAKWAIPDCDIGMQRVAWQSRTGVSCSVGSTTFQNLEAAKVRVMIRVRVAL